MTSEELIAKSHEARKLLDNGLLKHALETIKAEIVSEWEACPARDTQGREELWKLMKTARKFESILTGVVESGKIAENDIREKRNFVSRAFQSVRS